MSVNATRPSERVLLKGIDAYEAHMRLTEAGWPYQDVEYEEGGGKTSKVRHLHVSGEDPDIRAVVTEDVGMGLDFVDFYGGSDEVIRDATGELDVYSEAELEALARGAASEQETAAALLLVGVSAVARNMAWKQAFIERHMAGGSQRQRMTAILAGVLAARSEYLPAIEAASQDEDPVLRAYAAEMLEALTVVGEVR